MRSQRPKIAKTETVHKQLPTKSVENFEDNLKVQNPKLSMKPGEIAARFKFRTKGGELNTVVEVDSETRKKLLQTKFKMGRLICSVGDYLAAKRCYKCSRYNQNTISARERKRAFCVQEGIR